MAIVEFELGVNDVREMGSSFAHDILRIDCVI